MCQNASAVIIYTETSTKFFPGTRHTCLRTHTSSHLGNRYTDLCWNFCTSWNRIPSLSTFLCTKQPINVRLENYVTVKDSYLQ